MTKKILLGLIAVVAVAGGVAGMSAFEAHVINVTAKIENALFVHPEMRDYGTVFPQEFIVQGIFVSFSQSFSEASQTRVDTVEYQIKQKPKPLPSYEAEVGETAARQRCHDHYPQTPYDSQDSAWQDYLAKCYPLLCAYLSKHPEIDEDPFKEGNQSNDGPAIPAFHDPFDPSSVATGKIEKGGVDVADTWAIDLAVPCFEGQCGQDWASFVTGINPDANPVEYILPSELESQVFGCDLWFEVTDIY